MEDLKIEAYMPPTTKIPFQSKEYHVFLSFRGKDVRMTLVDHLYEALTAAGLNVFLDTHKLKRGEIIGSSLERAVDSSAVRIPIFSEGYANSAWCLREAARMLRTPGLIIPLFYYKVAPTHVRYPQGNSSPYKQAFEKHYAHIPDRYKSEEVEEWKDALEKICSRSGWSKDLTGGFEAQLVKTVVNDVINTFDRVQLQVAKHPVGLENITKDLVHKFQLNSEGGVINAGIWGIGGIGKTTLAKAIYNHVSSKFDAASFAFNVRATAADSMGLTKVQKKMLKDLVSYDGKVDSVEEGVSLFNHRLRQKRVLIVLDDVDGMEQCQALVGDWLADGSRVIITLRDQHILNVAGVSSAFIHEMSGLQINESLQLFSWHAFLRASPIPTHKHLSERIVEACKGHPLSLEVIGSFLYDKQNDPDCWTEAYHNITLHPDIHDRLKISYSALTEEEKEIFLDIACFFIGENKKFPLVFWKPLYRMVHTAVHNLSLKLLIKIDEKGVFDMHDHLRDMGRSIAEREREGSRLWDALHLRRGVSNFNNLSRLRLSRGNSQGLETFYGPSLRFLILENVRNEDITPAMLPPSLIWLRLQNCGKPSHSSLLHKIWHAVIQRPSRFSLVDNIWNLRIMEVDGDISNIQSLSKILGKLSQLQHLKLRHCSKLNKLSHTIGNLSQLQHLDLGWCKNLNNLPYTIDNLSQLQHLSLGWCRNLNNLPHTIGNLSQLQHLDLRWCKNLNNLPHTIGNLSQLQHLDLEGCRNLNNLPHTIGNLSQLQHLDLGRCTNLNNLPHTIGKLSQLQNLYLEGCKNLNNLPHTIGNLSQLRILDLEGCTNLNNLSHTIGNLSQLQNLDLEGCTNLNNLPHTIGNLSQLQKLYLEGCKNLNNLPHTIGNLSQLRILDLEGCTNLNNLPHTIGNLSQLRHLYLEGCINLNNLPYTIGNPSQLQFLDLRGCTNLNNLPHTIANISRLQIYSDRVYNYT